MGDSVFPEGYVFLQNSGLNLRQQNDRKCPNEFAQGQFELKEMDSEVLPFLMLFRTQPFTVRKFQLFLFPKEKSSLSA